MPMSLAQLESELVRDHKTDPNLIVYIRADEMGRWKDVAAVMDRCQKNGITRLSCRTEPPNARH
jgi:biopolymer transport protein ExbD